jgi:pyruvate dehydrogenase E1 component
VTDPGVIDAVARRVLWLSTLMIHHANHDRPDVDGLKVGGHQASCASVASILATLHLDFLRPHDRLAVKPHAAPAYHALQYLMGNLDQHHLRDLRAYGGLQSYPSRTKDPDRVDFSTGSVGIGSVAPGYAALAEAYVAAHFGRQRERPRFVSLLGDAELDEGSVWESIAEPALDGLDNVIWIVDLNRQSLDRVTPGIRVERLRSMFSANRWTVLDAKYGRRLKAAFALPGGDLLRRRIDEMPNGEYQRIVRAPASEVRGRLIKDVTFGTDLERFLDRWSDDELETVVEDLGGHDPVVVGSALTAADESPRPAVVFAYTIKGWGLPLAGDPLNHSAIVSVQDLEHLRERLGIPPGKEWSRFDASTPEGAACAAAGQAMAAPHIERPAPIAVPEDLDRSYPPRASSQQAHALVLTTLDAKAPGVAERIVTTRPDVATSTGLGGWINKTGTFALHDRPSFFRDAGQVLVWDESPAGRHIELGISENNLFLLLGQLGLTAELFGETLLPVGTLYDPFVARGLDALIYALYAGAHIVVTATPSGITLSPEGGAHQSVITPSIALELPGITAWEPCFAVETEWILLHALGAVAERRGSSYLRLSTRPIDQRLLAIPDDAAARRALRLAVLSGAYRLIDRSGDPSYESSDRVTLAVTGALVPEAVEASRYLLEDDVLVNVVNVTSADLLHRRITEATRRRAATGIAAETAILRPEVWEPGIPVVTVHDGHPHTLSWLPGALRVPGVSLGVDDYGQSGSLPDLYRHFRLETEAIVNACASVLDES